jgi:hypothetical protein
MELINVIAAGVAGWIFGAIWYGIMGKRWMAAADLTEDTMIKMNIPAFVGSLICAILVAGMMRHIFNSMGVVTVADGLKDGLGLGLFIATPWLTTNYLFAQRPLALIIIDGIYATIGCTVIGGVLVLF